MARSTVQGAHQRDYEGHRLQQETTGFLERVRPLVERIKYGTVAPNGNVVGRPGDIYLHDAGRLWKKGSGHGKTGWVECCLTTLDPVDPVDPVDDSNTYREIDFSSLADADIVNGANSIDGLSWNGVNATNAAEFRVGSTYGGIEWRARTASTVWNITAPTCPYITIPLSTLAPTWSAEDPLLIELAISATLEFGNDETLSGIHAPLNSPYTGDAARGRVTGTSIAGQLKVWTNSSQTTASGTQPSLSNYVQAFMVSPMGMVYMFGRSGYVSATWPLLTQYGSHVEPGSPGVTGRLSVPEMLFTLGFKNVSAGTPTTQAVVSRLRARRPG